MNETFMKERPVLPLILSMSLPMVISMLVNSLYNIVDSFFVAKISEDAMTFIDRFFHVDHLLFKTPSTSLAANICVRHSFDITFGWCPSCLSTCIGENISP